MTIDEMLKLRDHADAVVKIISNIPRSDGQPYGRFDELTISEDAVNKALKFFISVYPKSPLKVYLD